MCKDNQRRAAIGSVRKSTHTEMVLDRRQCCSHLEHAGHCRFRCGGNGYGAIRRAQRLDSSSASVGYSSIRSRSVWRSSWLHHPLIPSQMGTARPFTILLGATSSAALELCGKRSGGYTGKGIIWVCGCRRSRVIWTSFARMDRPEKRLVAKKWDMIVMVNRTLFLKPVFSVSSVSAIHPLPDV